MTADRSQQHPDLRLSEYYLITGHWAATPQFIPLLDAALLRGRKLIQLRIPGYTAAALKPLAESAAARCGQAGATLLINEHIELAAALEYSGVHLKSRQLMQLRNRPLPANRLVAASCHNQAEIERAAALALDFICLSPVLITASHPAAPALGWERFAALCRMSSLPVYALGGLNEHDLQRAQRAGASGIAGISEFWNAP